MTSKPERKNIKSSQEIARKSGRYSSTSKANIEGKKSAKDVHGIMKKYKQKFLKKHPPKKIPKGMLGK